MTLFYLIEPNGVFAEVMDVLYGGKRDEKTLAMVILSRSSSTKVAWFLANAVGWKRMGW